ncbi:MAG: tetratricopeptide repeat protein [Bacteroidaceae bacterium]|nr:tetratricopeptide repeat protein [Bacteroidaceae bacterium]
MSALTPYLSHPERLDRNTLYTLRTLVARHPAHTVARLMLLHNLFVLHDESFGAELRKAAFLVPDRRVLFDLVEADKYRIEPERVAESKKSESGRTLQVIDNFLGKTSQTTPRRQPTVADATTDYAAFLLSLDDAATSAASTSRGDATGRLVDDFLDTDAKFTLRTEAEPDQTGNTATPTKAAAQPKKSTNPPQATTNGQDDADDSFFTETLAKIYIKQGRFEKALEIISTISANYPNKSVYFADQMRYLRKLIVNNNHKK